MSATAMRRNYSPIDDVASRVREEVVKSLFSHFFDAAIVAHVKKGFRRCHCPYCQGRKRLISQAMNIRYNHGTTWVLRDTAIRHNREYIRHAINEECIRAPGVS